MSQRCIKSPKLKDARILHGMNSISCENRNQRILCKMSELRIADKRRKNKNSWRINTKSKCNSNM